MGKKKMTEQTIINLPNDSHAQIIGALIVGILGVVTAWLTTRNKK